MAESPGVRSACVATYNDTVSAELFVARVKGRKGRLSTVQFYETAEPGEVALLKEVDWDVDVPAGSEVFVASSGHLRDTVQMFWAGWRDPAAIHALSLFQEHPVSAALLPGDRPAAPPLTVKSRKMHYYLFRPQGAAARLLRHEFSGEPDTPGTSIARPLADVAAMPVVACAAPVPEDDRDGAVVAWVGAGPAACRVGLAVCTGDEAQVFMAEEMPDVTPFPNGRMGLFVWPEEPHRLSFIAQALPDGPYSIVHSTCDPAGEWSSEVEELDVKPGGLHAGACYYVKMPGEDLRFACLLTTDGQLLLHEYGELDLLREAVDPAYDFPIATTIQGRYEAVADEEGEVRIEAL
jgi:hypothetical protein